MWAVGQCLFGFPILQRPLQSNVYHLPGIPCDNCLCEKCTLDVARPRLKGQREARARTSKGNNDDDSQGSVMPSWMFKEESNRDKIKGGS